MRPDLRLGHWRWPCRFALRPQDERNLCLPGGRRQCPGWRPPGATTPTPCTPSSARKAHELVSPDAVQATEEFEFFAQRLRKIRELVTNSDSTVTLELGADGWPFPIPLVQQDGQWFFDTAAGRDGNSEPPDRPDELGAIDVCRAYVEAQREYASEDRDGRRRAGLRPAPAQHARHARRLFWPAKPGGELSPLGAAGRRKRAWKAIIAPPQ